MWVLGLSGRGEGGGEGDDGVTREVESRRGVEGGIAGGEILDCAGRGTDPVAQEVLLPFMS